MCCCCCCCRGGEAETTGAQNDRGSGEEWGEGRSASSICIPIRCRRGSEERADQSFGHLLEEQLPSPCCVAEELPPWQLAECWAGSSCWAVQLLAVGPASRQAPCSLASSYGEGAPSADAQKPVVVVQKWVWDAQSEWPSCPPAPYGPAGRWGGTQGDLALPPLCQLLRLAVGWMCRL